MKVCQNLFIAEFVITFQVLEIYLITRVSMQYRELLHEWAWYFHEP